ncbi:MAG: flagellin [Phycisphaerales bacterium]
MPVYGSTSLSLSSLSFGISRLGQHRSDINQSLERLSTGKRINRASDDPSGLIASNQLSASKLSLERRLTSFQRESTFLGAQEGALSVLADLTIELDALVVESANTGALSQEEQDANDQSVRSILAAIDQTNNSATFQGNTLLTGFRANELASIDYQTTDPQTGDTITKTATLTDLPALMESNPEVAQDLAKAASSKVSARRGAIGNRLNAIDSLSRAAQSELENTTEALSGIVDTDFAVESAKLIRAQILEQATIQTMLTQQKQVESMLDLLSGSSAPARTAAPKLLS